MMPGKKTKNAGSDKTKKLEEQIRGLKKKNSALGREVDRLRNSENIYQTIFENTGTITLIFDENTTITMVNSDFARRMGYTKDEVEGKLSWTMFIARDDLKKLKTYHALRSRDPAAAPKSYEFKIVNRRGEVLNIFMTIEIIPGTRLRVASLIDITDRIRAEEKIMKVGETERQKIGQDLHDDLAPHLIGTEVMVKILADRLEKNSPADLPLINRIRLLMNEAITKTRGFAHGLCPVFLIEHGLESALKELASTTRELFGAECALDFGESVPAFDLAASTNLYYIAQEAVQNAVKHGKARRIGIRLSMEGGTAVLAVNDDGGGFDVNTSTQGIGQSIMRYRARMINAFLDIESEKGKGSVVRVTMQADPRNSKTVKNG
jgi:PAS domain S-box-containing protein